MATDLGLDNTSRTSWKGFCDCVSVLRAVRSKDPRDRIFAALGFLQLDEGNSAVIVPDYEISAEELFILSELPDLEILTRREESNRLMQTLPTWVPDFTVAKGVPLHQQLNNASSCAGPSPNWRLKGSKLVLQGCVFATVKAVHHWDTASDTFAGEHATLAMLVKMLMACFDAVVHLTKEKEVYHSDPLEVLWRALIAN